MKSFDNNNVKAVMYVRVGNIEQLDYSVTKTIEDRNDNNVVGLYIRSGCNYENELKADLYSQINKLEEYCKENNIKNIVKYVDINRSANSDDRLALKRMIADIEKGVINSVIITSPSKLFRDAIKLHDFIDNCVSRKIEIVLLDNGIIKDKLYSWEELKDTNIEKREVFENDIEY